MRLEACYIMQLGGAATLNSHVSQSKAEEAEPMAATVRDSNAKHIRQWRAMAEQAERRMVGRD
jgi:hypothetical protein